MLKILGIEMMGFAGATNGGTCIVVNIETNKDRFPTIKEGMAKLSITVPTDGRVDEKTHKKIDLEYHIMSRLYHDDGDYSHWSEDVELTDEEKNIIETWCNEQKIVEKGHEIANEYKEKMDLYFKLHDQLDELSGGSGLDLKAYMENREMREKNKEQIAKIKEEIEVVKNRIDELKEMKVS